MTSRASTIASSALGTAVLLVTMSAGTAPGARGPCPTPEQEPNDACPGQPLGPCGQVVSPAFLQSGENDWYEFGANQNEVLTLSTDEVNPGDVTNTVLELYANDCNTLLAADDDGGAGNYSLIAGFSAPYSGVYHLRVIGPAPGDQGPYSLAVDCQPPKLTRQQAIDVVLNQYIPFSPFADSLVAFIHDPVAPDSTFPPGTILADWDSTFVETIPSEVYMFWIDDEPQYEFAHHTSFVLVDAHSGFVQEFEGDGYPVVNGEVIRTYVYDDGSPNRIAGNFNGSLAPTDYTPNPANSNVRDWAVIAVGLNLGDNPDERAGNRSADPRANERKSRQNDVKRIQRILNNAPNGPKIKDSNIRVVSGAGFNGATLEEICTALNAPPSTCRKLWFWYIGHGADEETEGDNPHPAGLILKGADGQKQIYPYADLAKKLGETGAREVCIVIEACYSGHALADMRGVTFTVGGKKRKLKGSIATSSSDSLKTHRITCAGAPFISALHDCWFDGVANLDKRGRTTLFEALAWARNQNDIVEGDEPQGESFPDGRTLIFKKPGCKEWEDNTAGNPPMIIEWKTYAYAVSVAGGGEPENEVVRDRLYVRLRNKNIKHYYKKKIQFFCKKGTQEIGPLRLRVKNRGGDYFSWRPVFARGQRVCIAELPPGCDKIIVKLAPSRIAGGPYAAAGGGARFGVADTSVSVRRVLSVYDPGELLYQVDPLSGIAGIEYTASLADTSPGWFTTQDPDSVFEMPALIDPYPVVIRADVPDTATVGSAFTAELSSTVAPDTTQLRVEALLRRTIPLALADGAVHRFEALDVGGGLASSGGGVSLDNCVVRFTSDAGVLVEETGSLVAKATAFHPDFDVTYTFEARGSIDWGASVLAFPSGGLLIDGAGGVVRDGGVFRSFGDGLTFTGDLTGLAFSFFDVDSAAANGVVFDGVSGFEVSDLSVTDSGVDDVVLRNGSTVGLLDSNFDASRVSVEGGSELTRSVTAIFLAVTGDHDPLASMHVSVTDFQGNPLGTETTDEKGFAEFELVDFVHDGSGVTAFTPHQVTATYGEWDTTFAVTADSLLLVPIEPPSTVSVSGPAAPTAYRLLAPAPNPILGRAPLAVRYELPVGSTRVVIRVFDVRGRRVREIIRRDVPAGVHTTHVARDGLADGVYFYELAAGSFRAARKITILE